MCIIIWNDVQQQSPCSAVDMLVGVVNASTQVTAILEYNAWVCLWAISTLSVFVVSLMTSAAHQVTVQ